MDIYEAVTSRRAVRGFTGRRVPGEVLERVLCAAAWAPSGSNLQPWHIYVLTGEPLAELKRRAGKRVAAGDPWDEREYEMYPAASQDRRGGPVTPRRARPLLRHVDRVRGRRGALHPYETVTFVEG